MNLTKFIKSRLNAYSSNPAWKSVKIGNQTWMATNLTIDDGGEGIYNHDGMTYYTWDAAMRVTKDLKGWHLPTKSEFEALLAAVGGSDVAGKALKSKKWWYSNGEGMDSFKFCAVPAGYRDQFGDYSDIGSLAHFWSSTECNREYAYYVDLHYDGDDAYMNDAYKNMAFSIRCIKD